MSSTTSAAYRREPSARALQALVQSTNPSTRISRSDDPRVAREKEEIQEDLLEMARQVIATHPRLSSIDETEVTDRIRRKVSRSVHGRSAVRDFDAHLHALRTMPSPPSDLPAILSLLEQLSFTGPSTSSSAAAGSSRLSPVPGSASSSRISNRQSQIRESRSSIVSASSRLSDQPQDPRPASAASSRLAAATQDSRPSSRVTGQYTIPDDSTPRKAPSTRSSNLDAIPSRTTEQPSSRFARQEMPPPAVPSVQADTRDEDSAPKTALAESSAANVNLADLGLGKVPKAVLLERWRSAREVSVVSERDLLRDVIFILQGINGHLVRFEEIISRPVHDEGVIISNSYQLPEAIVRLKISNEGKTQVPLPTRHLIHRLAETGKHYQRITSFLRHQATIEGSGRVMQSLCHFIDRELSGYYNLICDLEAQLNEGTADVEEVPEDPTEARAAAKATELKAKEVKGLTLKKMVVETEMDLLRMRLISSLVEGAQHAHGGSLVSLIHNYTFNGDPFIRSFTERLLEDVSQSFFAALSSWIYEGELHDPFKEFFVELNPSSPSRSRINPSRLSGLLDVEEEVDAAAEWENKFIFRAELVPTFLGETFARKIFSAGKSLHFIRYSCGDSDWKDTRALIQQKDDHSRQRLRYADLVGLERTIDSVHATVSKRLLDIFLDKFKLQDHLRAINDYMLLTKGDFADQLLEALSSILYKQASLLYRHSLTAALETAIRSSNAQYDDSDILRRLDARVLEFSGTETGWETFTLEYRVDSPVNTVLDSQAMAQYQQIFLHLWKMKRVELSLNSSFSKMIVASNGLLRIKKRNRDEEVRSLQSCAHRTLGLLAEMTHFMRQLQGYNQLEVIEYSWQDLQSFFAKRSGDLDELIEAHRGYLSSLHGKILLRGGKRGAVDYLAQELRTNFDTILSFCSSADDLAMFVTDELARRSLGDMESEDPRLPSILKRIGEQGHRFRERTDGIIGRLERHGNLVIRDLSVRLDYNSHYSKARPDRGSGATTAIGGGGERPSSGRG